MHEGGEHAPRLVHHLETEFPFPSRITIVDNASVDATWKIARELSHARIDMQCLDVAWAGGRGALLARFGGSAAAAQAEEAVRPARRAGVRGRRESDVAPP